MEKTQFTLSLENKELKSFYTKFYNFEKGPKYSLFKVKRRSDNVVCIAQVYKAVPNGD